MEFVRADESHMSAADFSISPAVRFSPHKCPPPPFYVSLCLGVIDLGDLSM